MKRKYLLSLVLAGILSLTGCKDEFKDININSSTLTEPNITYLFTSALQNMYVSDYWPWWHDYTHMASWIQLSVDETYSNTEQRISTIPESSNVNQIRDVIKKFRDMEYNLSLMPEPEAKQYENIRAMLQTIVVYMILLDSDHYGSRPYSEAYSHRYGGTLTPKYDSQEEIFNSALKDLDESVSILTNENPEIKQITLGNQDFVYKGNVSKWAKFANSLKLKFAVRLLHVNKEKALAIAKEVANSKAGMITTIADDFVYNQGAEWWGFSNGANDPASAYGSRPLINFMVKNKDPRVRFFYQKNDYNSIIIQAYFDEQFKDATKAAKLPKHVEDLVNYELDASGKKIFKGWKAPGEPWVRYHGAPVVVNAINDTQYSDIFDLPGKIRTLFIGENSKRYYSASLRQLEMYRGHIDYTFPDIPGGPVVQDKLDVPFHGLYFSSAEVNLYLTELKLLGADIPGSAQSYFTAAITSSVRGWDYIANMNQIPYYHSVYDTKHEESIALQDGELDALLQQPAYQLTGDHKLDMEKVYLQLYLHFIMHPQEAYVSARRGGVPMKGSTLLPFESFTVDGTEYAIPRRARYESPSDADKMKDIILEALKDQGFSTGGEGQKLNTERVWYDKGAPNYGEGPNL